MPRSSACLLLSLVFVACVEVPDGIRAQFAEPRSEERSNFRKGQHGLARPTEEPVVAKLASTDAGAAEATSSSPHDTDAAASTTLDGGAP